MAGEPWTGWAAGSLSAMRLLISTRQHMTVLNLGDGPWRFCVAAVTVEETPDLAVVCLYPPGVSYTTLWSVPVVIAQRVEEVANLAKVALSFGDEERDRVRLREAYQMFRNQPRVPSQDLMESAIGLGTRLLECYYKLQQWLLHPDEEIEIELEGTTVWCQPLASHR